MATANPVFTQVTEKPEWDVIRQRLGKLYPGAQFIALRPKGNNVNIVLGRQPSRLDLSEEKRYVQAISNILSSMYEAAQGFQLNERSKAIIEQLATSAGPAVSSNPTLAAAVTGAKLVLPFVQFHGHFSCVVVVDRQNFSQAWRQAWWRACLRDIRMNPLRTTIRASAQSWLWDVDTDVVIDTDWSCELDKGLVNLYWSEIPNLESAKNLTGLFLAGRT